MSTAKEDFENFLGFEAAQDAWLVLEGDYGGQIYLTVPWKLVRNCERILELADKLDESSWNSDDPTSIDASLYSPEAAWQEYVRDIIVPYGISEEDPQIVADKAALFSGIPGGMGGGKLCKGLWLHAGFSEPHFRELAIALLGLDPATPFEIG